MIDTSELIRVFGKLDGLQVHTGNSEENYTPVHTTKKEEVHTPPADSAEIKLLRQQVVDLRADKEWLQSQVTNLTDNVKLLTHNQSNDLSSKWWRFWK